VATVRLVEKKIHQVEGFKVTIRHLDGRDVRSDRQALPAYPFKKAMRNSANVTKWATTRFRKNYAGFGVDVRRSDGTKVHGRTLLSTVRDTYLED
jgi:hypothetical protein